MEPASAERTRRSTSGHLSRGTYTQSPLCPRSVTKRKRKSKASGEVYSVRDILEEKTENGKVHYLIDWADNPDTKEKYTPTWEPSRNVGWQAITDWKQKRLDVQDIGSTFSTRERSSTFDSDSELLHRTKRQRVAGGPVQRKLPQANIVNFTSVHPALQDTAAQIKDSYEDEQKLSSNEPGNVYVLVPKVDNTFDRSAYAIIPTSSDPSQASKPSPSSTYILPSPELKHSTQLRRPFLWDEPAPVIPDSQELPESSSYIISEQETPHSQDTQPKSSYISGASTNQELQQGEESSYHPEGRVLPDTSVTISSGPLSIEQSSLSRSIGTGNSRPSQLSVAFLTQDSGSREESWQAAQVRSPPPQPSTQISTQAASLPEDISVSQIQESTSQLPKNVIETVEKAEGSTCSHQLELRYPSSSPLPSNPTPPSGPNMADNNMADKPRASAMSISDMLKQARASAEHSPRTRRSEDHSSSSSPLPPRPTPPSGSNITDQPINSPTSIAEMLKQARASAAAQTMARQAQTRAASATPSTQPLAANQMLPVRNSSELQPPASPSSKNISEEPTSKALQILPLGSEEYVVPLPLNGITRDIYDGELTNFRRQQKAFLKLKNGEKDDNLVTKIDYMLNRLSELCDHQDLILSDKSTQEMDPWELQAAWAENISTKCIFLSSFLTLLRPFNIHVTIVSRPGRMSDIIEAILGKERCHYRRPNRPVKTYNTPALGPMRVSLLSSDFYKYGIDVEPSSMVIAFDSTFELERYPRQLRDDPSQPGVLSPLVRLTVVRSIEHFELCFDKKMDPLDRRVALVSCVTQSRHEVGVLPTGFYSPPAAAAEVGKFASAVQINRSWPLKPMPELDDLEVELDNTAEGAQPNQAEPTPESYNIPSTQLFQPTAKRLLSAEDDDASTKRLRLTPGIGDEAPRTLNPSRISSILNPVEIESSPRAVSTEKSDASEVNLTSSLAKKVNDLELELQRRDASHAELRNRNQQLEFKCKDIQNTVLGIQPKYQEALNDRARFEYEMKDSTHRANTMQQKLDLRVAELTKVKEAKATSDSELAAARTELADSAIPEVAAMNQMKDEMAAVRGENERLQKSIINMQNDHEYMRTNYQQASSAAAAAVSEANDLKTQLATAQQKASENARRIHEYNTTGENKQHLSRIRELETEKSELEWELEKKSEELKALLNGRRATRGTSVPRSPRMGTMSPGSRPMARVLSVGSRGNSPAPGDGPPYRSTFAGDIPFTTAPAITRFGNHLV